MKRKSMPWKDPDNWQWLFKAEFLSPVLAGVIAFLRAAYDDEEPKWLRNMLEASICCFLAVGAGAFLSAIGIDDQNANLAASSYIGLVGVDKVRKLSSAYAERKIGK